MEFLSQLLTLSKQHSIPVIILLAGVIAAGSGAGMLYLDAVETVLREQDRLTDYRGQVETLRADLAQQQIVETAARSAAEAKKLEQGLETARREKIEVSQSFTTLEDHFTRHLASDWKLADRMVAAVRLTEDEQAKVLTSAAAELRDGAAEVASLYVGSSKLERQRDSLDYAVQRKEAALQELETARVKQVDAPRTSLLNISTPRLVLWALLILSSLAIALFAVAGLLGLGRPGESVG